MDNSIEHHRIYHQQAIDNLRRQYGQEAVDGYLQLVAQLNHGTPQVPPPAPAVSTISGAHCDFQQVINSGRHFLGLLYSWSMFKVKGLANPMSVSIFFGATSLLIVTWFCRR